MYIPIKGVKIDTGQIKVNYFVIVSIRKITIGVKFEVNVKKNKRIVIMLEWAVAWYLDLQLIMQSVPITTDVVSSNHDQHEVYNIMW